MVSSPAPGVESVVIMKLNTRFLEDDLENVSAIVCLPENRPPGLDGVPQKRLAAGQNDFGESN